MLKANLPQHLNWHLRAKTSTTGTEPSLLFQLFLLRGKTRALQRQVEHWQQWPQRESFPVAVPEQHQKQELHFLQLSMQQWSSGHLPRPENSDLSLGW